MNVQCAATKLNAQTDIPQIVLGGQIAYAPQTAWIRNATVRENILFGQPDDEQKFRDTIRACKLEHDLEMLPNGEHTEIGEKGINLSGMRKLSFDFTGIY